LYLADSFLTYIIVPSKKIILLLGSSILAFGGIFVAYTYDTTHGVIENPTIKSKTSLQLISESIQESDSDSDSLKDWEEALWKTDPEVADTDKDGTSDGEEVKVGRDPRVGGPKDELTRTIVPKKAVALPEENISSNALFAREFFAKYIELKQQGLGKNPEAEALLIDDLMGSAAGLISSPKVFKLTDIKVIPDSDMVFRTYGNAMGNIIAKNSNPASVHELAILEEVTISANRKTLEKLDDIIAAYAYNINEFRNVAVPQSMLDVHLSLLNNTSALLKHIENFRFLFENPIAAIEAINSYDATVRNLSSTFEDVALFYISKNITFPETENGYVFTHL